ncbi:TlpA family protein disulfide reductase [Flavisericum labens]|uniref:TlpA family protein disulfide reductase n=1 Tax=Flavisericum labens TaxID=3377112 RepID=UPI00387AE451
MKRLFFLAVLFPSLIWAQHTIKGVFSPPEDYNVALLYKVTPTVSEYVGNSEIQKEGWFEFKLDSTAKKGIYRLVYAIPQEDYNFDIIYNGKESIELAFNSETGVDFIKSAENKLLASYTNSMSLVTQSIGNYFSQESQDTTALKAIFKTQRETQLNYEKAAKGSIALEFIKANKPFIPNKVLDVETYIKKLEAHYFDHIDFTNKTLQSSGLFQEKMLNFVFGMSSETKDDVETYKENIDLFCVKMKAAPIKVKRILLVDLWQQMADLGYEAVANHISENYLMDIAVALNDQELLHTLILYKDTSIGNEAPNFNVEVKENGKLVSKKLSDLNVAKNYIIVFWSSTCPHCLDEIPQLFEFEKKQEKGKVKVVAIALEDDPYQWKSLTYDLPSFIHVYGEGKWDNEIANQYGVTSTPTYFILNEKKEIAAKPVTFEDLKAFFDTEDKD